MHAFSKKLQPYALLFLSFFKKIICIQQHFAFLVGYCLVVFLCPIICFQPLKPHFLMYVLPLFNHVFNGSEGFCPPLRCVFLCFSSRVQQHFALRLAPKRLAFSTKMQCVQHQNELHLAPKCNAFSTKMHSIQLQIGLNLVPIAVLCNAYSFCLHLHTSPFCVITNLRENRFFAVERAIGGLQGHS